MILAFDDDIIVVYVLLLDAAQLPAANTRFKQGSQDGRVAHMNIIRPPALLQELLYITRLECHNDRLILLAPLEILFGIEAAVSLIIAILDKRLRYFQEAVDVAAFSSLLAHKRAELPHRSQIDFLYLLDVRLLLTKTQKEIEAIPIPANGLWGYTS